ncbi:hypothetical protein [Pseudohongiella nitratireducens]|uniref:hypothetical protein n=1 Tax=Pseudohongiella nitratireducens TaxID=1768907 RepID=UPI0030EE5D37|tara:strand:- start:2359 stop:2670 length:312 start_codon:yes stop_codon:yes gene_type:complete
MSDPNRRGDWHLDKSVSFGHILTTVTILLSLAAGWATMSERIAVLEQQQAGFNSQIVGILSNQRSTDTRQDSEITEIKRQIREDYREIRRNLDQLIRSQVASE